MKVKTAKDITLINGKSTKKFILMLGALLANKPKIKVAIFYNLQKQKAILDFLLNKFQKRSFLIRRIDYLRRVQSLFKNKNVIYLQGGYPKFHHQKKYIVKIDSLKDDKKLIKWRNQIKLENKLIHQHSITTIKQKIEYMIFKEIFNEGKNSRFRGKLNILGFKVLELKIVSFWKISLVSLKEYDLKLFNKFVLRI